MLSSLGAVKIHTTDNRGHNPEELAQMCVEKLIYVSDDAPPAIRDQARAFQNQMRSVITEYIKQGVLSDRTTVYNALSDAGHPELAELIRRM
jgi:HD superfamily phosphohydrolase YqeK